MSSARLSRTASPSRRGDPKGLLPGINAAIAQMLADNKVDEFVAKADELGDVAVEVSADAPLTGASEALHKNIGKPIIFLPAFHFAHYHHQ